ncbi:MAG: Stf0 family sulfotransferase [Pseudomonadota bacterium]
MTEPKLDFLIASAQRTGSGLLCELLRQSAKVGRVGEFLNPPQLNKQIAETGHGMRDVVLNRIAEASNGYARAVKLHYPAFRNLLDEFSVNELFPDKVVLVSRRDRLAQAISLAKARATGSFSSDAMSDVVPRYDYLRISTALKQIRDQDAQWRTLCSVMKVRPFEVVYEDLVSDPAGSVTSVLEYLGIELDRLPEIAKARRKVQRDGVNEDWRARFASDYRSAELREPAQG